MKFRNILTPSIDTPLTKGISSGIGSGGPCAKAAGTDDPFATAQAASKLSGPAAVAPGGFGAVGSPGMILQKKTWNIDDQKPHGKNQIRYTN